MRKILVVDDEPEVVAMIKKRLEKKGYSVATGTDGDECIQKATEEKPDLILLDISMPKRDGFNALRELKKDELTRRIPVIMLSGRGETQALFEGEKYGAIDYFFKPCDWEELLKYIRKYTE